MANGLPQQALVCAVAFVAVHHQHEPGAWFKERRAIGLRGRGKDGKCRNGPENERMSDLMLLRGQG